MRTLWSHDGHPWLLEMAMPEKEELWKKVMWGRGFLHVQKVGEMDYYVVEQGQFDFGVLDFGLWEGIFNTIDG